MALTPVQKELGNISADYRRFQILRQLSLSWAGLILVSILLLFLHKFFHLNVPYAVPAVALAAVACSIMVVSRNSNAELALRKIARQIEADDPSLNSLLLAALEQQPDPGTGNLNFLQVRVIQEALDANAKAPWKRKFTERLFFMQCGHLLLFIGVCAGLASLGFSVPNSIFSGYSSAGLQVSPGDVTLEKGSALAIIARFQRQAPEEVTLVYESPSTGSRHIAMTRSLNDPMFGASFTDLKEDAKYRVQYGKELSPEYHVHVFEYPELKRADAELNYPKYTGFKTAKIEATRRVTAVEGTQIRYTFFLNKPVHSAVLRGKDHDDLPLKVDQDRATVMNTQFPLSESGDYRLELVDDDGRTNKLPAEFIFVALKNERPKLKLQSPRGDQRVSALEEVQFQAEAEDDFGLTRYGLAYTLAGGKTESLDLSSGGAPTNSPILTKPHESKAFHSLLPLEKLGVEPGELVSYYLWADDLGPDGQPRRTAGDIYFAEVRPFEEIFRENNSSSSSSQQQQQQQRQNPASKLLELQKQIITASWNIQRRETPGKLSEAFTKDTSVVHESQDEAIAKAGELKEGNTDEKTKALVESAVRAMGAASKSLGQASQKKLLEALTTAINSEQTAYQALLKLQAHEYQISRSRSRSGQQSPGQQRAQRQMDQLELKKEENRYETESQAAPLQTPQQQEAVQVLSRLKELAQRQQDMSGRLKDLQTAINEAKSEPEREKLQRELKRLEEEQQQIVQDMDELRQRMSQPQNQSRMADARQQLDKTRDQSRETAQQMQKGNIGQALSSSSRAQQQLQQLSDEFRKSTSSQFAEQMRQMREQARELDKKQEEIAQKMEQSKSSRQRSLSDEGPKKEVLDALAQQKSSLTNLLQNMRQVIEQSETAEPLLSRQLYESLRKSSQSNTEKALDLAAQLTEKNFLPQASQVQESVRENIHNLREGVEKAATEVLGDEAESLRFAQRELQNLTERVQREMQSALRQNQTNSQSGIASSNNATNQVGSPIGNASSVETNELAGINSSGTNQMQINGRGSGQRRSSLAQNDLNSQPNGGEPRNGQETPAANPGNSDGNQANNNTGSQSSGSSQKGNSPSGQRQNGGNRSQLASNQDQSNSQPGSNAQRGARNGRRNSPGGNGNEGDRRNFFDQWATRDGAQNAGGGDGDTGPLIGQDYSKWSDRLRDIEEILQNPGMRTDVARVRERARDMRLEFKRHDTLPQWSVVQSDIVTPLHILQTRVEEELAHIESREAVAPVDRDPVPAKYTELVNRYYEKLGKD